MGMHTCNQKGLREKLEDLTQYCPVETTVRLLSQGQLRARACPSGGRVERQVTYKDFILK